MEQLAPGGRLVIPLGDQEQQELTLIEKRAEGIERIVVTDVRFVPLLGQFGFHSEKGSDG
jgi:protein-L-isoaspartate(D-aspartate) O-methyltransferase